MLGSRKGSACVERTGEIMSVFLGHPGRRTYRIVQPFSTSQAEAEPSDTLRLAKQDQRLINHMRPKVIQRVIVRARLFLPSRGSRLRPVPVKVRVVFVKLAQL